MEINGVVRVISSPATVATTVAPSVHQEMSDEGTQEELPNAEELLLPLIPLPSQGMSLEHLIKRTPIKVKVAPNGEETPPQGTL